MEKVISVIFIGAFAVVAVFLLSLVFAIPTMLLWNWLCPLLFKLPEVTLLQAWGLNFLGGMLFKGSCSSGSKE